MEQVFLVVARSSALAIVTMQIKFASSKSMRTPMLGDRAVGYPVNASGLTESVCVSSLEPTLQGIQPDDIYESCESAYSVLSLGGRSRNQKISRCRRGANGAHT